MSRHGALSRLRFVHGEAVMRRSFVSRPNSDARIPTDRAGTASENAPGRSRVRECACRMQRMLGVRRDSDGPTRAILAADGLEAHNQAARSIMRCVSVAVAAGLLSFPAFAVYSQE